MPRAGGFLRRNKEGMSSYHVFLISFLDTGIVIPYLFLYLDDTSPLQRTPYAQGKGLANVKPGVSVQFRMAYYLRNDKEKREAQICIEIIH